MKRIHLLAAAVLVALLCIPAIAPAQDIVMTPEDIIALTPSWEGERDEYGRPLVSDDILERMKIVGTEEAWGTIRREMEHSFVGDFKMTHLDPTEVMVGRALTATFVPVRPEVDEILTEKGHDEGHIGGRNSWPIDMLQEGDVYVANAFGQIEGGPIIGGNLATAIYTNSKNGVVFDGSIRDLGQIQGIDGFRGWVRGWHPSWNWNNMLLNINYPTRIGTVTVMPGDIVLATREGVVFIPPHLAEDVVVRAELITLRDMFGFQRITEGVYTPGQVDQRWSDEMEKDFSQWLNDHMDELPVPKEQIQEILKERSW